MSHGNEHETEVVNGKSVFKKEKNILIETIDKERHNKLNSPKDADVNFVGNTNQMINMFSLLWKSFTYGFQSGEKLPDVIKLNKETSV